jgi:hypothetical protein
VLSVSEPAKQTKRPVSGLGPELIHSRGKQDFKIDCIRLCLGNLLVIEVIVSCPRFRVIGGGRSPPHKPRHRVQVTDEPRRHHNSPEGCRGDRKITHNEPLTVREGRKDKWREGWHVYCLPLVNDRKPRIEAPSEAAFWNFPFPYFFRPIDAAKASGFLTPFWCESFSDNLLNPTYAITYPLPSGSHSTCRCSFGPSSSSSTKS